MSSLIIRALRKPIQLVLRQNIIWRLSGLTYFSAVIATKGKYMRRQSYLSFCQDEMGFLTRYLKQEDNVLEFGCGIGGNVVTVSRLVKKIVGIDINPFFIKIARNFSKRYDNCALIAYDGHELPFQDKEFDVVFSMGVFERIPKPQVQYYMTEFNRILKNEGICILYFLKHSVKFSEFTNKIGDDAYIYFDPDEIHDMHTVAGFKVNELMEWAPAYIAVSRK